MFSPGKIQFAIFFIISFVIIITLMYKKDLSALKKQYKGTFWVLIGFISFIGILILIKFIGKSA